jgi:hypothetical protein
MMRRRNLLCGGAALLVTLGCGGRDGGSSAPPRSTTPATELLYQASLADTSAWRLELDPASTGQHLLLDLLAPAGTSGQGFTVVLGTDPGNAVWSTVDGSHYAVQSLFSAPLVNLASVSGGELRIVFGQAPGTAVSYAGPVVQVALDLAPGATVGDVVLTASESGTLGTSSTPTLVTVSVGSLQAE